MADELQLKSGEKLTGSVMSIKSGKMMFRSDSLGVIEVERAKIKTFSTDREVKVKDGKGVLRRGRAVNSGDGLVKFEAVFVSDEAAVNKSKVTAFAAGEELKISEIAELNLVEDDAKGTWSGWFHASATGTRSTTDTNEVDIDAFGESESDLGRLKLWGWYEYGNHERDGEKSTTKNNYGGGAQYDFKLTDGWYLFARGQVMHDEIREIERQWLLAAGVGKTLVDADGVNFRLEAGISHLDEKFRDYTEDRNSTGGYVGYTLKWHMADHVSLIHELFWYPAFGSDKNTVLSTWIGVEYEFQKNWTLGFRLSDDYSSRPAESADKNRFKYGVFLGFKF